MLINYVLLALIGSGVFENVSSRFFEIYFFLSFTIIPIVIIFALLYTRFKKEDLFRAGQSFSFAAYQKQFVNEGTLNNNKVLGFSFEVSEISDDYATISITKA